MSASTISIAGSVRWIGVGQSAQLLVQLIGVLVLARFVPPEDFGLLAMASTVVAFAALFRDMGTGAALIQRERLSTGLVNAVFWFNVLLGIGLALFTATIGPLAVLAYGDIRLQSVLLWLAAVFPLASVGIVHQSMLQRDSRFLALAAVNVTAGIGGLAVAILLAWKGAGVYALVSQALVTNAICSFLLWWVRGWRPEARFAVGELRTLFSFSGNLVLFNVLNYFHRNADTMLIGRFLGPFELGLYNLAYRVLLLPLQNLTLVVNLATLPAYSRQQRNYDALAEHYVRTLRGIALITGVAMAVVWVTRAELVALLLGNAWLQAADVIAWLAPTGYVQALVGTSGSLLTAIGRTRVLRNLGLVGVPFLICSFVVGLPWGIVGVAAAYAVANLVWMVPVLHVVLRELHRDLRCAVPAIAIPALIAVGAATVATLGREYMPPLEWGPVGRIIWCSLIAVVFYGTAAWLFLRDAVVELWRSSQLARSGL